MEKVFTGDYEKVYDGNKPAKLGTEKRPAIITVPTKKRMSELIPIFKKNGWHYTFHVERDKPEDLSELKMLQKRPKTVTVKEKAGRNEPCPCGSGKKYKNCCGS